MRIETNVARAQNIGVNRLLINRAAAAFPPIRAVAGNFSAGAAFGTRFPAKGRPGMHLSAQTTEGYMNNFFTWLEQVGFYIAAVTGLGALSFVAMRLLA